ncbi:MAG: FAD binding domain-containing protein [Paracoccaceae bacterium]
MSADYFMPTDLDEAFALLKTHDIAIVAGGTDFFPVRGRAPLTQNILDLSRLDQLQMLNLTETHLEIGAGVTWTKLVNAKLPNAFLGLQAAGRDVGSIQIQNAGTVVGNICNASPAADGMPPLLTLDAEVRIASQGGDRLEPLHQFITGVRRTTLQPGEIVTGLRIPTPPEQSIGAFQKLGARRYLVISIAMTAVVIGLDDQGHVDVACIAVGACSAVAQRLHDLEHDLLGHRPDNVCITADHLEPLAPISDIRGDAAYRLGIVSTQIQRAINDAVQHG